MARADLDRGNPPSSNCRLERGVVQLGPNRGGCLNNYVLLVRNGSLGNEPVVGVVQQFRPEDPVHEKPGVGNNGDRIGNPEVLDRGAISHRQVARPGNHLLAVLDRFRNPDGIPPHDGTMARQCLRCPEPAIRPPQEGVAGRHPIGGGDGQVGFPNQIAPTDDDDVAEGRDASDAVIGQRTQPHDGRPRVIGFPDRSEPDVLRVGAAAAQFPLSDQREQQVAIVGHLERPDEADGRIHEALAAFNDPPL